jgi:hypothetical protein
MREFVDLRLYEDWARGHLDQTWGSPLQLTDGSSPIVRQVVLDTDDPRFTTIKRKLALDQSGLISALDFRTYQAAELSTAPFLHLIVTDYIDCCGEDYGTVYDDSSACPRCGFGRNQVSPLILDVSRTTKSSGFLATIARGDELLVSGSLADLIQRNHITGCTLAPIQPAGGPDNGTWYQLIITAGTAETKPPTKFASSIMEEDAEGRFECPEHNLLGLNLVSEVCVAKSSLQNVDIQKTIGRYGTWSNPLMPSPILLISQRFFRLLNEQCVHGYRVEVGRIAGE